MLVVENGDGLPNANTYLSVDEADAYHDMRANSAWDEAELPAKEAALVKATEHLDTRYYARWKGWRRKKDQALEWPRVDVWDESGYIITDIPQRLKDATAEAALRALDEELAPDYGRESVVKRESVGPVSVEYRGDAPTSRRYPAVEHRLAGLLRPAGIKVVRG